MKARIAVAWAGVASLVAGGLVVAGPVSAASDTLREALSAAWPGMAKEATVVDWEGNVLQEGSNGYTCMPTPPSLSGTAPLCLDAAWMAWAKAWQDKQPFTADRLGIAYMLQGDAGASNVDPYAAQRTDDNQWIVEGPHLMIIAPAALLGAFPTDPDNGGPYVMWKGTDYQHLMVPVGTRPAAGGDE
ncbi:MAG: hypothetical protein AWU55_1000 [Halomonadaceae bacterium T82-2]|nr:MAG: hypothetical protein AWU55_1000 [Halomonadaceae bacterium T82-2]